MIVVKLGGSLFEHPGLKAGLRAYLQSLPGREVALIPGGGILVEAIRKLDRAHGLGEETSHWLALQAMTVAATFVARLIDLPALGPRVFIPDCLEFAREDDLRSDALPHCWMVTSDSIAARYAEVYGAERLVLLKSLDIPPGIDWAFAAEQGWVDRHFPLVVAGASYGIEAINFAHRLNAIQPLPFATGAVSCRR